MNGKYTAIIRKSKLDYVAVYLEMNVTATGETLADVEKNLRDSILLYLEDIKEHPETEVSSIPIEDFLEFLNDTEPDSEPKDKDKYILKPLELHEVAVYA